MSKCVSFSEVVKLMSQANSDSCLFNYREMKSLRLKDKGPMDSSHSSLLVIVFLLCFFAGVSSATRPGLFYTRQRGRCTPQYWSSRREAWPRMVPERSTVEKIFGVMVTKERWRFDMTLVESTARNDEEGNAYGALLKQGIAALLNSYARKGFSYAPWQVKTLLIQAMISEPAARRQAQLFAEANVSCD